MNYSDEELESIIKKTNEEFYELVFKHPWLKQIFDGVDQEHITNQQTDFILQALGGPKRYGGRNPKDAHPHIFIQEDMWIEREILLKQAFETVKTPKDIQDIWIRIDESFKHAILNKSPDECFGRFKTEEIINIPNPTPWKKTG
jgi:hemoglobin